MLTRDGGTIEERDVFQKFGVTGAPLAHILQPTAGAKRQPLPNIHKKTKRMAATIAEKKDTFDFIAL